MARLKPTLVKPTSPLTGVLQTLSWCRKLGFKPVPVHYGNKAAIPQDWAKLSYSPPDDAFWNKTACNIGVITGPQSKGPVDLDLDCPEAVFFAKKFLPATPAIFGRKSKALSHYLYRVEDGVAPYRILLDPKDRKPILEVRGDDGHQTVMPGSVHESGETIEWALVAFPDPPVVPYKALFDAAKMVAVATVLARHVWLPGRRNGALLPLTGMFYYIGWPEDQTCEMVRAVMEYVGDNDKSRIPTIKATYRRAAEGSLIQGANALRKFLEDDSVVDGILKWIGPPEATAFMRYNERFAVVNMGGKFRVAETEVPPGELPIFYQKNDFLGLYGTEYVNVDEEPVPVAKLWLSSPRRRTCSGVDFLPGKTDTGPILNLWTGWSLEPNDKASCKAWLELLHGVICGGNDEHYHWMLNWFANIVQTPMHKPLTAPVIIGTQGAGKSLLLDYFGQILGKAYTTITNPEHLIGQFNSHTAGTILLHSEEALFGGERKHRGIIKSLITDSSRMFEQKGVDAKPIANYLRLVLTSNERHAAPAEHDDRRFTVLDLGKRKSPRLCTEVVKEMNSGGPSALFRFLLDFPYDAALVRTNVKNEALTRMKFRGVSALEGWWLDRLMAGTLFPEYLQWAQQPVNQRWPKVVGSVALYQSAVNTVRGWKYVPQPQAFYEELYELIGVQPRKGQRTFHNTSAMTLDHPPAWVAMLPGYQQAFREFPSLKECRDAYCQRIGQEIQWPEEEPENERPAYLADETPPAF